MSSSIATESGAAEDREATRPMKLPRAGASPPVAETPAAPPTASADDQRNPMFELLVRNEADMTGLLAYALYKQNKRDWLIAFQTAHGRPPTDAEAESFILGERIERRTATYRQLAEEMLRRDGTPRSAARTAPMQSAAPSGMAEGARPAAPAMAKPALPWRQIAWLLLALVGMAIVFRFAGNWLFR